MILRVVGLVFVLNLAAGIPFIENKISGGTPANIELNPWLVSLQYPTGKHFCGGSIISRDTILTAAHCIDGTLSKNDVYVRVGSSNNSAGGAVHQVAYGIMHDRYGLLNGQVPVDDIALLKLKTPITFHKTVQPVKLFDENEMVPKKSLATVTGWGIQTTYGGAPQVAHTLNIPIVEKLECDRSLRKTTAGSLPVGQICAGYKGSGKNVCVGDSGSPMTIGGRQVGIVSWAVSLCGEAGAPRVFTEIASYRDWIRTYANV